MDELKKLRHLIEHWMEHNEEHERTYRDWAAQADILGRPELADILRQIAHESKQMEELFSRAKEAAS